VIGEIVGNYRIVGKLSVGGMGTVYKAQHQIIGKLAAVKVLHPELCTNLDIVNRFLKEAQATTTIKHPGIVDVIDFGYMKSGHAFLVMEFLDGMSLARRLKRRGKLSEGEAAMLLRAVCAALGAAHDKRIVHRDLKPDNIFLVPDPESALGERPKLLDFGIAKLTDVGLAGSATKTGAVMGTPTYMAPEQCRGTGHVDHRADLYSIGCIYYELVTGRPPFRGLGAGELLGAHIYVEPEPPSVHEPTLSPLTEALIMSLLEKRPERRPQSARELGQRLTALVEQQSWITAGSPSGVTAQELPSLPPRRRADRGGAAAAGSDTSALPGPTRPYDDAPDVVIARAERAAGPEATAPAGAASDALARADSGAARDPALAGVAAGAASDAALPSPELGTASDPALDPEPGPSQATEPTTLSGAARQSAAAYPRRARRRVGLAMLAAAVAASGAVVAIQLTRAPAGRLRAAPATGPAAAATAPATAHPAPPAAARPAGPPRRPSAPAGAAATAGEPIARGHPAGVPRAAAPPPAPSAARPADPPPSAARAQAAPLGEPQATVPEPGAPRRAQAEGRSQAAPAAPRRTPRPGGRRAEAGSAAARPEAAPPPTRASPAAPTAPAARAAPEPRTLIETELD
jgi:serine/threonine-protein kinase